MQARAWHANCDTCASVNKPLARERKQRQRLSEKGSEDVKCKAKRRRHEESLECRQRRLASLRVLLEQQKAMHKRLTQMRDHATTGQKSLSERGETEEEERPCRSRRDAKGDSERPSGSPCLK